MSTLRRLLVITERGRVIGTQVVVDPPAGQPAASALLQCGPGQTLVELEVEMPTSLKSAREIEAFHAAIARRLKTRKPGRRKRR
jgi:hypothetical protein